VKGCFALEEDEKINGVNIIIVDDVTTTGATIAEAKKVLEQGNPESVSALTFAH
jgi:competence protein ComFC